MKLSLTVLERKGDTFRGKLVVPDAVERIISGTVKDGVVSWRAKDVQAVKGGVGADNSGRISGDRIDFVYGSGTNVRSMTLHRSGMVARLGDALDDNSFDQWRDYIRPDPEELEWMKIGWRPNLAQALIEAHRQDKPILVWGAVGNPVGWT